MKKPVFVDGNIYHVYNRGVEKRDVFLNEGDYFRFVHHLYELNDSKPVRNVQYFLNHKTGDVEARKLYGTQERDVLVEILVFTLMHNHFHLMLRQAQDNGIVRFMQKLGTGYTMYFNKKYERVGGLFQGRFKACHIVEESHLIHLPHYIHTNPLPLGNSGVNPVRYLENYKWSSFPDYVGIRNFPRVTKRSFLLDIFGGEEKYRSHTEQRLNDDNGLAIEDLEGVIIE
jgi:putative transposase